MSLDDANAALVRTGEVVTATLAAARDTAGNREAVNHFVGIERWGQSRVRVALGAPFVLDRYHGYRLPDDASLPALVRAFRDCRAATLALVREVADAGVDPAMTITHNDIGDLTVIEWFVYLSDHSKRELIRIRT